MQVLQLRVALRETEGRAEAAQSRLTEVQSQLDAERRIAEAAIKAAGSAQRSDSLVEKLREELQTSHEEIKVR